MSRQRQELMCLFLMCDEKNPDVDYNTEGYMSTPISHYMLETDLFLQGTQYLLNNLKPHQNEEQITTIVFDAARCSLLDMNLFFKRLYQTLFKQDRGPKLASLISLLGTDKFNQLLIQRLDQPLSLNT